MSIGGVLDRLMTSITNLLLCTLLYVYVYRCNDWLAVATTGLLLSELVVAASADVLVLDSCLRKQMMMILVVIIACRFIQMHPSVMI